MFKMETVSRLIVCISLAAVLFGSANSASARSSIGLYADSNHSVCQVFNLSAGPQHVDLWIWCKPDAQGLQGAEFKINYPPGVTPLYATPNTDINLSIGSLEEGISFTFATCQTNWVWTHHQGFIMPDCIPGTIEVAAHPSLGLQYEDCTLEIQPFTVNNYLYLNQYCTYGLEPSVLICASVESPTILHAFFIGCMSDQGAPFEDNFVLYDKSNPIDSICVVQAVKDATGFTLTLERTMVHNTTYVLKAWCTYNCIGGPCRNLEKEFFYEGPTGTRLRRHWTSCGEQGIELVWELSEADDGIAFFVSRSEDEIAFKELATSVLRREGSTYTYQDSGIEPGKRYTYKVEYALGGERRLLFVSEPVETPAARLALHQNRPNPFNPSTTIAFDLPHELVVSLEVYDVSGRLVTRLIGEEKLGPGPHSIEWNGDDARGTSVSSGIYIYRLVAGKNIISRKMVLLQ